MSIDFDSAALQTQHDEEEYDPEDYAREQELHKLLTDLPHDMLDDSRESSSPELECSNCSKKNSGNSPKSSWPQPWGDHPKPTSHPQKNYEPDFNQGSHDQYTYEDGAVHTDGHRTQPHSEPLPHTWNQDHQFSQGDYTCTSVGTEKSAETGDFSNEFESEQYTQTNNNHVGCNGDGGCRDQQIHYPCGAGDNGQNKYKASYNPHHTTLQPKMFNPQRTRQDAQFDHLQREFLDSTQQNAERQQLAQLQILNKAQQRQIEDLEQKLEDSRRNMRYLEHQFAIVKDERDGFAVSLKESSQLVEEAKVRDVQMQNKLKAMEQQVQILNERDQENLKKQRVADAAVDTMKQQMLELCRSDTLSRAREQHDRDLTVMKEQQESALLALQQKLDSTSQALDQQIDVGQNFREQLKHLERQREEEQLERARVVNGLTHRLEESQQQCAKLLETNSVQEMSQMQIKLQQAQSAKALSENMNKVLQEDMADLQEQIHLYESAVKHGVVSFDLSNDWENHLSESCLDLGLKKTSRKNGTVHSTALAHLSDSKLPKDEALQLLRVEMQRCLGSLKGKRQKISQLQEELQLCRTQVNKLQNELDEVKVDASAKEISDRNPINVTGDAQKELLKLQEDKQNLQKKLELLDKTNKELKQTEGKLKSANSKLCTKMREMIQELDQEKQEATERSERIHQQYRDDVVNRIRADLLQGHDAQIQQLHVQHQQQVQQLQTQLSEVNNKMLAVQECYISICKEKDMLGEGIRKREQEEAVMKDESDAAVDKLRAELEAQHQASVLQLKVLWSKEKETEVQQKVDSHIAAAKAAWKEELQKTEKTWVRRVEDARREKCKETCEMTCQTEADSLTVGAEELDSRLSAQKHQLRVEADRERSKAVEETIKRVQREAQEKHLEDMAKQVEGAVTRAYNRWIDDLASLPEYQACLQTQRNKWEELQEKHIERRVSEALRDAGEQWRRTHTEQLEEQRSGAQRVEELQEEVAALQSRLDQVNREHAALLKAELAAVKAAWNRDKQREIAMIKTHSEQTYQTKLQEQSKKLQQTAQGAQEDTEVQKKELLLKMEAKLQQTLRTREEEWRRQHTDKQAAQREQMRAELMAELQTGLAELQAKLLRDHKNDPQDTADIRKTSGATLITQVIQTSCTDLVNKAVSQAKKRWEKMSDERLNRKLKETQERHEREFHTLQASLSQCTEASACKKECLHTTSKLQKKNQELQRHLEKTCRHLQLSVREHKAALQNLKDEHRSSLQRTKEEHLQQLAAVNRDGKSSRNSNQQKLQQGLEEMKQQYLTTVEKIREDMLRYLQESRERAAEMIRKEVQRERQDTARKMRHYYLTCLQELLEDGGKTKGAEKKIMNAASKLVAMAKVLETPVKCKSEKIRPAGLRSEERPHRDKTRADSEQKLPAAVRTELSGHRDSPASRKEEEKLVDAGTKTKSLPAHKSSQQVAFQSHADSPTVSTRSKSRELHLQGSDSTKAGDGVPPEPWSRPFFVLEVPVREKKRPDWSMTSTDSDSNFNMPRLSFLGRQVEPVKPFAVSAAPGGVLESNGITPDDSDMTVYNEIAQKTPPSETLRKSTDREPTPGSECERQQAGSLRPLYSELRRHQQDSGFDSPFY